jgi:hypothetical protein
VLSVSASLLPLLHELVARHPSLAVRVAAGSALSQEGEEESIDVLGGANSRLRLPAGDVLVACSAVAEAASGLAQLSRTKLEEGESERLCVEGMQMAVRMRPYATSVCGVKVLVYEAFRECALVRRKPADGGTPAAQHVYATGV